MRLMSDDEITAFLTTTRTSGNARTRGERLASLFLIKRATIATTQEDFDDAAVQSAAQLYQREKARADHIAGWKEAAQGYQFFTMPEEIRLDDEIKATLQVNDVVVAELWGSRPLAWVVWNGEDFSPYKPISGFREGGYTQFSITVELDAWKFRLYRPKINAREALESLEGGHGILSEQGAMNICAALGVSFPEKYMMRWQTEQEALQKYGFFATQAPGAGIDDLDISYHVAQELQIGRPGAGYTGRGFQARANVRALRQHLSVVGAL